MIGQTNKKIRSGKLQRALRNKMFPPPNLPLEGGGVKKVAPPKGRESKVSDYAAAGEGKGVHAMQFEEDESCDAGIGN